MKLSEEFVEEVADDAVCDGLEWGKHTPEQSAVVHLGQPRVETGSGFQKVQQPGAMSRRRKEVFYPETLGVLTDAGESGIGDRAFDVDRRLKCSKPRGGLDGSLTDVNEADAVTRLAQVEADRRRRGCLAG